MLSIHLLIACLNVSPPFTIRQAAEPILQCRVKRELAAKAWSIFCFAHDTHGKFIYTGHRKGDIQKWDENWKLQHTLKDFDNVNFMALSSNGQILAAGNGRGTVRVWETTTWSRGCTINCASTGRSFALSPDGKLVATLGKGTIPTGHAVTVWDTATHRCVKELSLPGWSADPGQFSEDNLTLITPNGKQFILWNTRDWTSKSIHNSDQNRESSLMCISQDRRLVAVCGALYKAPGRNDSGEVDHLSISIYSYPDLKLLGVIEQARFPMAFSPNNDRLVCHNASYRPGDMDWCMVDLKHKPGSDAIPPTLTKQQLDIRNLRRVKSVDGKMEPVYCYDITLVKGGAELVLGTRDGFLELIPLEKLQGQ
jgi:hypothetical protein